MDIELRNPRREQLLHLNVSGHLLKKIEQALWLIPSGQQVLRFPVGERTVKPLPDAQAGVWVHVQGKSEVRFRLESEGEHLESKVLTLEELREHQGPPEFCFHLHLTGQDTEIERWIRHSQVRTLSRMGEATVGDHSENLLRGSAHLWFHSDQAAPVVEWLRETVQGFSFSLVDLNYATDGYEEVGYAVLDDGEWEVMHLAGVDQLSSEETKEHFLTALAAWEPDDVLEDWRQRLDLPF